MLKQIKTEDAVGHVLCHDITKIVRGVEKGAAFRKGHVVTAEDIPHLLDLGKEHLYVLEMQQGMLHENDAAAILYGLCAGKDCAQISPTPVSEGKIEAVANTDGLLVVDAERLRAVNLLEGMAVATRRGNRPVRRGQRLAGMRVIPLVIEAEKMQKAREAAGDEPLIRLIPYRHMRAGIVVTGNEVAKGRIKDTFTPVVREKLGEYGIEEIGCAVPGDDSTAITQAVKELIERGAGLVLCTGGMSVDPDDRTPAAIKDTGARVVSYGSPVLPGAMFMLAYLGDAVIMGLPGCVMYAGRTVFDIILPRVLAGVEVTAHDIASLGHGGLCLGCGTCVFPNCGYGTG